ncbi:VanW family protein [Paenibacillus thermoaerophilus]|uniref:VanW family protein n=1 Tax=Paenibacillus thermoaerophilus TaxID=1215385 RepID=A0ABW2V4K0_9BACL|nr:VanW family protein [Paenibacillus thermoaerophilus]
MIWIRIAGALLMMQPAGMPDNLLIEHGEQIVADVQREDYAIPGADLIDMDKFDKLLHILDRRVYEAPENAKIDGHGRIVPERPGFKLNRRLFAEQFFAYYFGSGSSTIRVPRFTLYAKVDSELLAHLRVKQIGYYVTYYNSGNANRSHNIALAAKAIDSQVVFPGEIFSFNRTVGQRTAEKGYVAAPIIVRGELSEGIGGGICQVSSTLFNAADRAGLKIVQRYSHSRNVSYVLPGRDATVSWGGPDFAFQNAYNQAVLIRAFAGGGRMQVAVYSSDLIEYKPREVPGITERLPEEISTRMSSSP